MAANTPDLPHNEGDTFTNDETGIKYSSSTVPGVLLAVKQQKM